MKPLFSARARARARHVYTRRDLPLTVPFKFVCPSTFVYALIPAQREREREGGGKAGGEGLRRREKRDGTGREKAAPCAIVVF